MTVLLSTADRTKTESAGALASLTFRDAVRSEDAQSVQKIVVSTGYFTPSEINVAVELVEERMSKGDASGYHFLFAEQNARTVGYACFGPIACTVSSYDLFWIAVEQSQRGGGIGREILTRTEMAIARMGGRRVYIETSSRPLYEPTRAFYLRNGYTVEATLKDFYSPGDDKVIFVRSLSSD